MHPPVEIVPLRAETRQLPPPPAPRSGWALFCIGALVIGPGVAIGIGIMVLTVIALAGGLRP